MTNRFTKLFIFFFLSSTIALAQDDKMKTSGGTSDELTVDSDQNKSWRMGQSSYSAKPKNAWEVGLHTGHFFIDGDVDRTLPGGFGVGLHLRKAIHYVFSVRGDLFYGRATGLETQMWTHSSKGGGLVEREVTQFTGFDAYANEDGWIPSHRTQVGYVALQGVVNVGNLLFHKDRNKWNWYTTVGTGLSSHQIDLDLQGADGKAYSGLSSIVTTNNFNTKQGRRDIWDAVNAKYDGVYETEAFKKKGIFRVGDETNIHVVFTASMGVSRKLSKRFNLGIEHQIMATDNDYLDGIQFRTASDQTNDVDMMHYTNLRLGVNLGNFNKVSEPLYWLNPLDAQMSDIAALKQRPVFDLTDTDGDGVIDMLDQEMDTQTGAPVDTRGIALDSDNDGIKDHSDKEPFSPGGYNVDKNGVADVKCCLSMDDVNKAIDAKVGKAMSANKSSSECGKWFLPMIHYDLDKSNVKPEFYGHLHHVASVMKMCPDVCVTAHGHTDVRSSNNYNNGLSYNRAENAINYLVTKYGIDRSRFKIMYGGEDANLATGGGSKEHLMNRRVEFRVCAPDDKEMGRPEGTSANTGKGKSVKGAGASKFTGNKNAGY